MKYNAKAVRQAAAKLGDKDMTDETTNTEQSRVAADCPNERLVMCFDDFFKVYNVSEKDTQELLCRLREETMIGSEDYTFLELRLKKATEEIEKLRQGMSLESELLDLLDRFFTLYEDGPQCYESQDDYSGFLGHAVRLDDETFHRIGDILNERRPRT